MSAPDVCGGVRGVDSAAESGADVAAARGGHYVEESVSVYLMADPGGSERWVIDPTTVTGEPLYSTLDSGPERGNCECDRPVECAAHTARLMGVDLPDGAELVGMLLEALVARSGAPVVEAVAVRDPDGPTEVSVFVCGVPVAVQEWTVDAGAGWDWERWQRHRDRLLGLSSPGARAVLAAALADPPGGQYVEGRESAGWLGESPAP